MSDLQEEQQDLFLNNDEPESQADRIKSFLKSRREPSFTVSLEVMTAILAVMAVLLVVFFYMGFLRGETVQRAEISHKVRQIKVLKEKNTAERTVSKSAQARSQVVALATEPAAMRDVKSVAKAPTKPYTIQVIAYRNEPRALREVSRLYQKGYASRLIKEGNYFVVCVGEYLNRKDAGGDYGALKREYKDCFLRKF